MTQKMTYIAGVGCRMAAGVDDILGVVRLALACNGLEQSALSALACIPARADHAAIREAAATLALPLITANAEALAQVADRCITRSGASLAATGLPSASEAATLAVADSMTHAESRLIGPRNASPQATCAISCALSCAITCAVAGAGSQTIPDHLDQQ